MSSNQSDLTIAISAKVDEALKSFDLLGNKVAKTSKESKGVFGDFTDSIKLNFKDISKFSIGTFVGGAALDLVKGVGRQITGVFSETIKAASEQEDAIIKLNNSLKQNGEFTENTSKGFQKYADSLSRVTSVQDDVILSQIAIAKTFGATDEQAKKIIETATGLQARLGKDFSTSVLELSGTLEGATARSLIKVDGGLRNLDEAANKAGKSIDILYEKFGKAGSENQTSFTFQITNLSKAFGELGETFGGFITGQRGTFLESFTNKVYALNDALTYTPTKLQTLNKELNKLKDKNFNASASSNDLLRGDRKEKIAELEKQIEEEKYKARFDAAKEAVTKNNQAFEIEKNKSLEALATQVKEQEKLYAESYKKTLEALKIAGKTELEILKDKEKERLLILGEARVRGDISDKEFAALKIKNQKEVSAKLKEIQAEQDKKDAAEYEKFNKESDKALDKKEDANRSKAFQQLKDEEDRKKGIANTIGLGANVLKGSAGVTGVLSAGASVAFGPEIGSALAPVIEALSGGPEQTKALVKSFAEAAPVLIGAIIDSIPVLIIELAEQFPVVIDKLVQKIPDFITGFVNQIPFITDALIMQTPKITIAFIDGLISGIPKIVEGLASAAYEAIKNLFDNLNPFSSEGGGFFNRIGDSLGFANGGEGVVTKVPAGFNNKDSFPSMMKTGEVVLDRSLTTDMRQFLTSQKSGTGTIDAAISGITKMLSAPIVTKAEVKLGNKAFADIIVELKRQNQRLA